MVHVSSSFVWETKIIATKRSLKEWVIFFYSPFQRKRRIIVATKYASSKKQNPIDHSSYAKR
jgi:hypothetical protein